MLKPGGRLLITDYCCADSALSEGMREYIEQRGYHLLSIAEYTQLLRSAGFADAKGEDRTQQARTGRVCGFQYYAEVFEGWGA